MKSILSRLGRKTKHDRLHDLPSWFRPNTFKQAGHGEKPFFLFQSWIPEHTNKLISSILDERKYELIDLELFDNQTDKSTRVDILRYAEENGDMYRKMALHKLAPYMDKAAGLIVTLDWIPAMRHLVYAAAQLHIPTILVPHESVFAKRSMYYVHSKLGINLPACDLICAWGNLQSEIFVERGYPNHRILITGAPKLDYVSAPSAEINRMRAKLVGLNPLRPIISFAAQPLDSQYDQKSARASQDKAVLDLVRYSKKYETQLIIRTPPSRDKIFDDTVLAEISGNKMVFVDNSLLYLLSPEQTIECSDVIVSLNSTMLLEAALLNRPAISAKYIEFDQLWDKLNIPVVRSYIELEEALNTALADPTSISTKYNLEWARTAFSNGEFDGNSSHRIRGVLTQIASKQFSLEVGFANEVPFQPKRSSRQPR